MCRELTRKGIGYGLVQSHENEGRQWAFGRSFLARNPVTTVKIQKHCASTQEFGVIE